MGKNKKNKNQNRINLDDSDDDTFGNSNNPKTNTHIQLSPPPVKKNVFNQLNNLVDDEPDDIESDEYCDYCGRECDGAHAIVTKLDIKYDNKPDNKPDDKPDKKPDEYFAKAYHVDDYEHDYENAITLYKSSIEHDSDYYKGVSANNIGVIYEEKLNDINNAETYYKLAADKYNYKHAYTNLGLLYFNKENYKQAKEYLHIAAVKYINTDIYYEYSQSLEKTGNIQDSFKYLQYHLMLKNANNIEKKMWFRLQKNCFRKK